MATTEDRNDSLTCCICLEFYDNAERMPKFLMCFHTYCLCCLKTQVKYNKIECPLCRKVTHLKNQRVENMTNNFYLLPKVEKLAARRKHYDMFRLKTESNWAQTIALRRNIESKLKSAHDACRLLESVIAQKYEENGEKIVILQSLIETPTDAEDIMFKTEETLKEELEISQKYLFDAERVNDMFLDVEGLTNLGLKNQSGQKFEAEPLRNQTFSFNNTSAKHGPQIGAALCMLTFILHQLKENNLLRTVAREVAPAASIASSKQTLPTTSSPSTNNRDSSPHVYLQLRVNGILKPYIVIKLDNEKAPRMCQTFLDYCRGVNNVSYKGTRISNIDNSLVGGMFKDMEQVNPGLMPANEQRYVADLSSLPMKKGAVQMRCKARCKQGDLVSAEFSIINSDESTKMQATTVFGHVVTGMEVCEEIRRLNFKTANNVVIADCGDWLELKQ